MDWRWRTLQLALLLTTMALVLVPSLFELQCEKDRLDGVRKERQDQLSSLRAQLVADRISHASYEQLLSEFAALTGLEQREVESVDASVAVGRFVEAVEVRLRSQGGRASVALDSISTGPMFAFRPFASLEFRMHLRGTFFSLPDFMELLTEISQEQGVVVSVGVLSLSATEETQRNGRLSIVIPVRAYVLAQ